LFWFKKTKQVKGKRKRYLAPSDWKSYYGSSKSLMEDVTALGEQNFKREILHLCKNKGECSYMEAKEQFDQDVLHNPDLFYNDWIIVRVHRKHILRKPAESRTPNQQVNPPSSSPTALVSLLKHSKQCLTLKYFNLQMATNSEWS
jgi:hypothetical protein